MPLPPKGLPRRIKGVPPCPVPDAFVHPDQARYDKILYGDKKDKLGERLIPGCCCDTELMESLRGHICEKEFTRKKLTGIMIRYQIPKVKNAIVWKKWVPAGINKKGIPYDGHLQSSHVFGTMYASWVLLLHALLKEGIIKADKIRPPPPYETLVMVDLSEVDLSTVLEVKVLQHTGTSEKPAPKPRTHVGGKELWSDEANAIIAETVQEAKIPIWELMLTLSDRGLRQAGSSLKQDVGALRCRMTRMIGGAFTKEELQTYREKHATIGNLTQPEKDFLHVPKGQSVDTAVVLASFCRVFNRFIEPRTIQTLLAKENEPKNYELMRQEKSSSGKRGSHWDKAQIQGGVNLLVSLFPLSRTSGIKNCKTIAKLLRKSGVRPGATGAAVLKMFANLMANGTNVQYGLTAARYELVCTPMNQKNPDGQVPLALANLPVKMVQKVKAPEGMHDVKVRENALTGTVPPAFVTTLRSGHFDHAEKKDIMADDGSLQMTVNGTGLTVPPEKIREIVEQYFANLLK